MNRDAFVDVYVALEFASETGVASPSERERILAEHETTEDALLEFADVHGSDPALMKDVWDEVERRLQEERSRPR